MSDPTSSSKVDIQQPNRITLYENEDAFTLSRAIDKLGVADIESVRQLVVELWIKYQVGLYRAEFEPSLPASSALSLFHHRANWMVAWINQYRPRFADAFPEHWFAAENVLLEISRATAADLKAELDLIGTSIKPIQVLDPLLQAKRLEDYVSDYFVANAKTIQFEQSSAIQSAATSGSVHPKSAAEYEQVTKAAFQRIMSSAFDGVIAIPIADCVAEMRAACLAFVQKEKWDNAVDDGIYPSAKLTTEAYRKLHQKLSLFLAPQEIVKAVDHCSNAKADLEHFQLCHYLALLNLQLDYIDKSHHHGGYKQDECVNVINTAHYCNMQYADLMSKYTQSDPALTLERVACVATQSETIITSAAACLLLILSKRVSKLFVPICDATHWPELRFRPIMNCVESIVLSLNSIIRSLLASLPKMTDEKNLNLYIVLNPLFCSLARRVAHEFEKAVTSTTKMIDERDMKRLSSHLKDTLKFLPLPTSEKGDIYLVGADLEFTEDFPNLFKSVDSFLSLFDVPSETLIKVLKQRGVTSIDGVKLSDMVSVKPSDEPSGSNDKTRTIKPPSIIGYDKDIDAAFRSASEKGDLEAVQRLHLSGANVNAVKDLAIRMASKNGHLEVVKFLVANGANLHAFNEASIRLASENGHLEVVKFLHSKGADIHADMDFALRWSCARGHLEVVAFLVSNGANISTCDDAAICYAAGSGHLEVVKFLHARGVNIRANNEGAFLTAARDGRLEVVQYLLLNGCDIQAQNNQAIRLAATMGCIEVVKFLHVHGADIHAMDGEALRVATRQGHSQVISLIKSLPKRESPGSVCYD